MNVEVILLILASYLLGSVPAAYLVARWLRGVDLRKYGTGNVGASNLVAATSKRWAVPVIIFDLLKGVGMVWAGGLLDFTLAQQAATGVAAIVGHNWSVFLRFSSGRGVLTTLGVALAIPWLNGYLPLAAAISGLIGVARLLISKDTAPALAVAVACVPIISLALHEPAPVTLAYFAIFLIIFLRRLTAPRVVHLESPSNRQLFLNRLLFDREVRDKKTWMNLLVSRTGQSVAPEAPQHMEEKP